MFNYFLRDSKLFLLYLNVVKNQNNIVEFMESIWGVFCLYANSIGFYFYVNTEPILIYKVVCDKQFKRFKIILPYFNPVLPMKDIYESVTLTLTQSIFIITKYYIMFKT